MLGLRTFERFRVQGYASETMMVTMTIMVMAITMNRAIGVRVAILMLLLPLPTMMMMVGCLVGGDGYTGNSRGTSHRHRLCKDSSSHSSKGQMQ